jgi:hypothetical protein
MNDFDVVNACFEFGGAWCTWRNAYELYKVRKISGVYWPMTAFFATWGLWNLVYYPALGQWWSFAGGIALVLGNLAWVILAVYLKRQQRT